MSGRMIVALAVLFVVPFTGVVRAQDAGVEVIIELVADPPGPYNGGESVTVDVWLHSQVSFDDLLHLIQFDFSESDPLLAFDPTLTFDYSSISDDSGYEWRFPGLPVPWTANFLSCVCPDAFLLLPGEGSLHIASIGLKLPTDDGTYRVDALNADAPDISQGARLLVRGADLRAFTGEISGGALDLRVNPGIPTLSEWGAIVMTCLLLLIGARIIVRRNREMERTAAPSGMRNCRDIAPGLRLKGICASALCLGLPATLLAQPAP